MIVRRAISCPNPFLFATARMQPAPITTVQSARNPSRGKIGGSWWSSHIYIYTTCLVPTRLSRVQIERSFPYLMVYLPTDLWRLFKEIFVILRHHVIEFRLGPPRPLNIFQPLARLRVSFVDMNHGRFADLGYGFD